MRSRFSFLLFPLVCLHSFVAADEPAISADPFVTGAAVVREINLARQDPSLYATYLEERQMLYPAGALNETIRFLRSARPLQPLILSAGLCRSAADHCTDQIGGQLGHTGRHGSNPARRMTRYGVWGTAWAENISYGKTTPRDIVIQLIVDAGLPGRKHRKNIFNANFNYAGAAYGPHAIYRSVCNIDFAGSYIERDSTVIARNY